MYKYRAKAGHPHHTPPMEGDSLSCHKNKTACHVTNDRFGGCGHLHTRTRKRRRNGIVPREPSRAVRNSEPPHFKAPKPSRAERGVLRADANPAARRRPSTKHAFARRKNNFCMEEKHALLSGKESARRLRLRLQFEKTSACTFIEKVYIIYIIYNIILF